MQDFAAKILCDNLQALTCATAASGAGLPQERRINRAYVHTVLKTLFPALLLGRLAGDALQQALALIGTPKYSPAGPLETAAQARQAAPSHEPKSVQSCVAKSGELISWHER